MIDLLVFALKRGKIVFMFVELALYAQNNTSPGTVVYSGGNRNGSLCSGMSGGFWGKSPSNSAK